MPPLSIHVSDTVAQLRCNMVVLNTVQQFPMHWHTRALATDGDEWSVRHNDGDKQHGSTRVIA